jgi:LysM repeat protein
MRDVRQVFWGIVTALVSIALLFGAFSLSLAEGNLPLPAPTLPPVPTLPPTLTLLPAITLTRQPSPSQVDSPTPLPPTWTPTLPPPPTNCPPPPGWQPYIVLPGDTLDGLALRYRKTSAEISQANCLGSTALLPGLVVYLPPLPTPTRTPASCGAPSTWIIYIVQQGDTLYHLGQVYGIPYTEIQRANCMTSSTIHTGQRLYVPPWAPRTPSPTIPGIPMPTDTPTYILPSDTPWATWTDTPTATASDTAIVETSTPTDTDTAIATPTDTATP